MCSQSPRRDEVKENPRLQQPRPHACIIPRLRIFRHTWSRDERGSVDSGLVDLGQRPAVSGHATGSTRPKSHLYERPAMAEVGNANVPRLSARNNCAYPWKPPWDYGRSNYSSCRKQCPEHVNSKQQQGGCISGVWRGREIRNPGTRLKSKPPRIIITCHRLDAGLFLSGPLTLC